MPTEYPELVFGLVGAIGCNLEAVQDALEESLIAVGYSVFPVKISDLMRALDAPLGSLPDRSHPKYYEKAMNAGNAFCAKLDESDALAKLAVAHIRDLREAELRKKEPIRRRAYVLSSLKRPDEIKLLRRVYGASFFAISAYAPRASRVDRLAGQLATRQHKNQSNALRSMAEELILRDESEAISFGQDVRKTYPLSDFFVRTSSNAILKSSVNRFVELVFGNMWHTPSKDEQGMMLAYVASLRSASPARQVGAALTDEGGLVISTGTNEVPRAGGGQYWENDPDDGRDYIYESIDISDKMRMNLLTDVLSRLKALKLLRLDAPAIPELLKVGSKTFLSLREAQLFDTIDFIRAVHAEMSALLSARESTKGANLYVTTFPCHECARHIVAAGVRRVVYIESYPKSLVSELFRDSIDVDAEVETATKVNFIPFTGVAPQMYIHFFRSLDKNARKGKDGAIKKWSPRSANPHIPASYSIKAKHIAETAMIFDFTNRLLTEGIKNEPNRRRAKK